MIEDSGCRVAGIILAAGESSRMHRIKQLLPFRGKPLLAHVLENAARSSLSEVIVVLGSYVGKIRRAVDFASFPNVRVIFNRNWHKGQSASLQAGLAAVSADCEGAVCLLGDQPLVDAGIIDTLIQEFDRTKAPLVIPTCGGRRGNPVVIHRALFPRLRSLAGDLGARALFAEYTAQIAVIEVAHHGIHFDIDTWQDYLRLKEGPTPEICPLPGE